MCLVCVGWSCTDLGRGLGILATSHARTTVTHKLGINIYAGHIVHHACYSLLGVLQQVPVNCGFASTQVA